VRTSLLRVFRLCRNGLGVLRRLPFSNKRRSPTGNFVAQQLVRSLRLSRRITYIFLCYRRRRRQRLELHREFRASLGRRLPIRNRVRFAPNPHISSPPPRLCPFSQHAPLFLLRAYKWRQYLDRPENAFLISNPSMRKFKFFFSHRS